MTHDQSRLERIEAKAAAGTCMVHNAELRWFTDWWRATCDACGWIGPGHGSRYDATHDAIEHNGTD